MTTTSLRPRAKKSAKKCAFCDRTFTKEDHLRRHERSHTGEKPFKCHQCDRSYGRSDVLVRHLHSHSLMERLVASRQSNLADEDVRNSPPKGDNQGLSNDDAVQTETTHLFQLGQRQYPLQTHRNQLIMPAATIVSSAGYQMSRESFGSVKVTHSLAGEPTSTLEQPVANTTGLGANVELHQGIVMPWSEKTPETLNENGQQDWNILAPLIEVNMDSSSNLDLNHAILSEDLKATGERQPAVQEYEVQSSIWQLIQDHCALVSKVDGTQVRDLPASQDSQATPHMHASTSHILGRIPGSVQFQPANADFFLHVARFNPYTSLGPSAEDFFEDYFDFHATSTPTSTSIHSSVVEEVAGKEDTLFSAQQVERMRRLWHGQRPAPKIRIGQSIWRDAVQHSTSNIFSKPVQGSEGEIVDESRGDSITSGCGFDGNCRNTIKDFCKILEQNANPEDLAGFAPQSASQGGDHDAQNKNSTLLPSTEGFLDGEVLDASLYLFFQCSYLPFIHRPTFDAQNTPPSVLFPMLLIGLSSLYPKQSKSFVLRYLKRLMCFARSDLTSKALGNCRPWDLLVSTASTLLVIYLSLCYLEDIDEGHAHMLCVQMLHIAEKHGMFAASDHDNLMTQLQACPPDSKGSWESWCRVESLKRMVACLLWMDMAYTRLMGSAGVVNMDKVELHLPCDDALFQATSAAKFLRLALGGNQLVMPKVSLHSSPLDLPLNLSHFSIETLLAMWYLKISAIRYRLPIGNYVPLEFRSHTPVEAFTTSSSATRVISYLTMIPARYANLFRERYRMIASAWHYVNISLTVDLDLLEIASGRDGLKPARTAITGVSAWAQTCGARRAVLHAAQIFDILASARLQDTNISRPDLLLFNSALVLSMYLFASARHYDEGHFAALELLQNIEWSSLGGEGLQSSPETDLTTPSYIDQSCRDLARDARQFIRHGGPVTFAGEASHGGGLTPRRLLLNYVRLLDDLGKWRGSKYSRLLWVMSVSAIKGNHLTWSGD